MRSLISAFIPSQSKRRLIIGDVPNDPKCNEYDFK